MFFTCIQLQHHWFDLHGIGYGGKEPTITKETLEMLDKRWNELKENK